MNEKQISRFIAFMKKRKVDVRDLYRAMILANYKMSAETIYRIMRHETQSTSEYTASAIRAGLLKWDDEHFDGKNTVYIENIFKEI